MSKEKQEQPKDPGKEKERPEGESVESQPIIGLTFDEYDALEKKLQSLRQEIDDQTDQHLRARAYFENYKKRLIRDSSKSRQEGVVSALKIFLVAADDLELALKNRPAANDLGNWLNGIELIHQKLINQIKNQGVERMEIEPGDEFDPNVHEAITQEEHEEFSDGQIIEVVQPGYRISDRIIRPAKVRVAK